MIIGLTNARIKFPDVADLVHYLVHYLMNSDEDCGVLHPGKPNSPSTGLS